MKFDELACWIEAKLAHAVSFALFLAWCAFVPLWNVDVANYGISFITAFLLFLTLGSTIKERKATHIKLDDLEESIQEADSGNVGIEKRL